ncbi:hypothetical protein SEA_WHEELBITE_28 [Arthrobacter phage Wheelbite]|uniref:Minor tail protein n=1 Tax=Arthrobacter phage Wheelbite TaxID=2015873 RepID=A0A222ZIW9_9CAUD|nr:hypothetical protein KMD23_gp28 [Arthrobacter phage Wheelbite]ASR84121.1 hypothetical protein SEA_WHEELBITE_28 [Arthrobacter phage Wheelbite]
MVFTPADPTKAEVKVIQNGNQLGFDFYIPRGAKGEPGNLGAPIQIAAGTDWNTLTTSGLYWTLGGDYSSFVNAPVLNVPGGQALMVHVVARGATILNQRVTLTTTSTIAQVYIERSQITGNWGPWRYIPSVTLKDDTTGRTAYLYDWINNRSQIVYGDTGRRNISNMAPAETTFSGGGKLAIRREGSTVDIYCVGWMPGAAGTVHLLASGLPAGFRPSNSRVWWGAQNGQPVLCTMSFDGSTIAIISNAATTHPIGFSFSYSTTDVWPTTLPGTADGAIPNI